jgi:hypothetical protein
MRKTSVRELHIRRGQAVAELRPIAAPPRMSAATKTRIFSSMQDLWDRLPQVGDSTMIVEEDRDR